MEEKLRHALTKIKLSAESHPLFMGYPGEDEITEDEINQEGGDAAFVTLDIAWVAKVALEE